MKTLKELRKTKGLTMGKLSELSGVSAKTISLYEQSPPVRPSKKVVGKLSEALEIGPDELLTYLSPAKKRARARVEEEPEGNIMLEENHVARLIRLLDKEIEELRYLLVDCADLSEEHPALGKCIDTVDADIDLLSEIKGRFQG